MHLRLKRLFICVFQIKPALYSLTFILALFVLILNDFVLKNAFSNTLTGKLSDFCGLYAFAFFFSQIFPANKKLAIHIITAVLFILWKSSLSDSFISVFSIYIFTIDRVVDYSDLWALIVLPLSYFKNGKSFDSSYKTIGLSLVALIAFTSTSRPNPTWQFFEPQYLLFKSTIPISEGMKNIEKIGDSLILIEITEVSLDNYPDHYDDFQQKALLENLDKSIFCEDTLLRKSLNALVYRPDVLSPYYYKEQITIGSGLEKVSFLNGRLHGAYNRYTDRKKNVNGYYKNGIPDSTWTYYTDSGSVDKEDFYINGEKIRSINYLNGKRTSCNIVYSRHDKILFVIILFIVTFFIFITISYFFWRQYQKATQTYSILQKIISAIFSAVISIGITSVLCIVFAPAIFGFETVGVQMLCLIFGSVILMISYFFLKRHSVYTYILIIILFCILIVLTHELNYIDNLKSVCGISSHW